MTREQVLTLIRKAVAKSGNQATWAAEQGVSGAYVSMVLGRQKDPSPKLCAAVGVELVDQPRVKTYRKIKP
jgi:hypothetical protein